MAIITTYVVHTLLVCPVSLLNIFVEFGELVSFKFQSNVLMGLSEGKIIFRDIVGSSEVIDDSIGATDAGVAYEG